MTFFAAGDRRLSICLNLTFPREKNAVSEPEKKAENRNNTTKIAIFTNKLFRLAQIRGRSAYFELIRKIKSY